MKFRYEVNLVIHVCDRFWCRPYWRLFILQTFVSFFHQLRTKI